MKRQARFDRRLLVVVAAAVALSSGWLVAARIARERAGRTRCARNLAEIARALDSISDHGPNRIGTIRSSKRYLAGVEGYCQPANVPLARGNERSDASRAFIYLFKKNFIDRLYTYACPDDPFVAPLDGLNTALRDFEDRDFPPEGGPAPDRWATPDSPARRTGRHTFYSYSMQAGSSDPFVYPHGMMDPSVVLLSDRNPWSDPAAFFAGADPFGDDDAANTWNHGRQGQTVAHVDGSARFIVDSVIEWKCADRPTGFEMLWMDDPIAPTAETARQDARRSGMKRWAGVGTNQPFRAYAFGNWMFD